MKSIIFSTLLLMTTLTGFSQTKTIVCFGNSLTYGFGISETEAYPALIAQKLQEFAPGKYRVINSGINGETSAGGLKRLRKTLDTLKALDIFILELGTNDAIREIPLNQVKINLSQIIQKVKTAFPKAQIILAAVEMPAFVEASYRTQFKDLYSELTTQNQASLIPSLLKGVLDVPELTQEDNLHPNAAGMKVVAENVWAILSQRLKD